MMRGSWEGVKAFRAEIGSLFYWKADPGWA